MKKILLLGGSAQQVIAIETAKRLGFYTILCDYLDDNPGQYVADKFYLISTTDMESVLKIAKKENIDGIIAYASDPAAPTAAFVAESMGLPTNPYKSVDTLCNKDKFRLFLRKNGFNTPVSCGYLDKQTAKKDTARFSLPVIVKPVDSSGSKGATVLYDWCNLDAALEFAFSYSRGNRIIIEEFIEKKHEFLIGGDVFVSDGKIFLWGLLNCHRDNNVNPLVPVGKSYPLDLDDKDVQLVKETLQKMVDELSFKNGALNVELVIDKNNRVWPIDIGPRNGGNMIPDLLGYIFNVDTVEIAVKLAMGENIGTDISISDKCWATHNLHSSENKLFSGIDFSDNIDKFIFRKNIYKKTGDAIEYFDNASKALGIVFMKFDDKKTMLEVLSSINDEIHI